MDNLKSKKLYEQNVIRDIYIENQYEYLPGEAPDFTIKCKKCGEFIGLEVTDFIVSDSDGKFSNNLFKESIYKNKKVRKDVKTNKDFAFEMHNPKLEDCVYVLDVDEVMLTIKEKSEVDAYTKYVLSKSKEQEDLKIIVNQHIRKDYQTLKKKLIDTIDNKSKKNYTVNSKLDRVDLIINDVLDRLNIDFFHEIFKNDLIEIINLLGKSGFSSVIVKNNSFSIDLVTASALVFKVLLDCEEVNGNMDTYLTLEKIQIATRKFVEEHELEYILGDSDVEGTSFIVGGCLINDIHGDVLLRHHQTKLSPHSGFAIIKLPMMLKTKCFGCLIKNLIIKNNNRLIL